MGGEGARASLEAPEGTLKQCMALAQAPAEVCLVRVELASVGVHEPWEEQVSRVPDEDSGITKLLSCRSGTPGTKQSLSTWAGKVEFQKILVS